MFKLFNKNSANSAVKFLQKKDLEIATAYRSASVENLKNGFTINVVREISDDIVSHKSVDRVSNEFTTSKYVAENLTERRYEVVSETDDTVVIRRDVNFKSLKVRGIVMAVADSFTELITLTKTNNGFMVAGIAAA